MPLYIESANEGGIEFLDTPALANISFINNKNAKKVYKKLFLKIDKSFDFHNFTKLGIRNFPSKRTICTLEKGNKFFAIYKTSFRTKEQGYVILFNKNGEIILKQIEPSFDFAYPLIGNLFFPKDDLVTVQILGKLHTYEIKNNKLKYKNSFTLVFPFQKFPLYNMFIDKNLLLVFNSTFSNFRDKVPLIYVYSHNKGSFKFDKAITIPKDLSKEIAGPLWKIHRQNQNLPKKKIAFLISEAQDCYFMRGFENNEFYYFNQINHLLLKGNINDGEIILHTRIKKLSQLSILQVVTNEYSKEIFILQKLIKGKQKIDVLSSNLKYKYTLVYDNKLQDIYIHRIVFVDKNTAFLGIYEKDWFKIIKAQY
jgi:hypothetical protein